MCTFMIKLKMDDSIRESQGSTTNSFQQADSTKRHHHSDLDLKQLRHRPAVVASSMGGGHRTASRSNYGVVVQKAVGEQHNQKKSNAKTYIH